MEKIRPHSKVIVFKNPFLEALTHVNPWTPLLLWLPTTFFLLWRGMALFDLTLVQTLGGLFSGLFIWTLAEYLIHRYLFHYPAKSAYAKRMVFIFHGLHHDDPKDETRLVMPPAPAFLYIVLLFTLFSLLMGPVWVNPFMGGFILGYLVYDYIHFGTHFIKPRTRMGKFLRKYHLQHHASHDEKQFGVSSPFWDYVFRTHR